MKKNIFIVLLLLVTLASCGKEKSIENQEIIVDSNEQEANLDEGAGLIDDLIEEIESEADNSADVVDVVNEEVEEDSNGDEDEEAQALDISTAAFTGNGTEPFWGFSYSGSTLILREPSDTGPMLETTYSGIVVSSVGGNVNMSGSGVNLDLTLGTCSDGMSDIVYDYSSEFLAGSKYYQGCANVD